MRRHPLPRHAVVFDCDGTLVATQGVWDRAYATVFNAHGRTIAPTERRRLVGLSLDRLGHALAELLDRPGHHAILSEQMLDLVTSNLGAAVNPLPGAVELVTALSRIRPIAVASNTPRVVVMSYLEAIGLADAFDAVLGGDDIAQPKPGPDAYLAATARLGVHPRDTVAIEDSPVGVASARAAGICVVGVPSAADLILAADMTSASLADPALWRALHIAVPARQIA